MRAMTPGEAPVALNCLGWDIPHSQKFSSSSLRQLSQERQDLLVNENQHAAVQAREEIFIHKEKKHVDCVTMCTWCQIFQCFVVLMPSARALSSSSLDVTLLPSCSSPLCCIACVLEAYRLEVGQMHAWHFFVGSFLG